MSNGNADAISPAVQAVLDLFEGELSQVKFADMDHALLGEAAAEVQGRAAAVAEAEARLQAARDSLAESQDGLLAKCQRGLAYARIYAEDDADLLRRLEGINLPRRGDRGKNAGAEPAEMKIPTRRGRRATTASGGLFVETSAGDAMGENGLAH